MIDQTRPDFVMVGATMDNGVMLLASTELTYAELESERDIIRHFGGHIQQVVNVRYTLSTEMREYVTIVAPTYAEAFDTLFKRWSPHHGEQHSITAGHSLAANNSHPHALQTGI
ncbi:hypothetical protein [Rhodococcus sp. Leaf233]|uniref:hypothetical protein n=1 Tax=Rhodococcus sp. Leaf233 TaxID=1736302 RepID=UPI000708A71F|nr:hypothetical protein [Rhodococcus sp. Leaf233]KQU33557.1 hypothetical protein ASH04_06900 [Rhodococcus sp. Leaf233]